MSGLWQKALEAAEEARLLLRQEHPNGAVSRAYYAAFSAARVLLIEKAGLEQSDLRRHSAVLRMFSERFVKTGLIPAELGRGLRHLFDARASADYDEAPIANEEAATSVEMMDRFVSAASALLAQDRP